MLSSKLTFISLADGREYSLPPFSYAAAIGNFDGVHRGHRCLIERAVTMADRLSAQCGEEVKSGVFCFSSPPSDFLSNDPPRHISTLSDKLELFGKIGADFAIVADFEAIRHLTAENFISLLKDECNCKGMICGFNFRFAKGGMGNAELLASSFGENGCIIPPVLCDRGEPVSSSRIRALIADGEVAEANKLLGHPFTVKGTVKHGKALGRQWGIPTVNLDFGEKSLLPGKGIYISSVSVGGRSYPAVTNVGTRPTVEDSGRINCETHLTDFSGELYGEDITVELLLKIRDEKKFASEEELAEAIRKDVAASRNYFSDCPL